MVLASPLSFRGELRQRVRDGHHQDAEARPYQMNGLSLQRVRQVTRPSLQTRNAISTRSVVLQ